jgi:hypothetical protein
MTFSSYVNVDSARILMSVCYDNDAPIPHGNSVLYIDNLSFDSLILASATQAFPKVMQVSVYPVPSKDQLYISFSTLPGSSMNLSIINVFGEEVMNQTIAPQTQTTKLDVATFPKGIYFIRVSSDNHLEYHRSILIGD